MDELVDLHRRVVTRTVEIVGTVTDHQLGLPTPCAGWTLEDLLGHMIAQHHGFAAAARGARTDRSAWEVAPVGDHPAVAYAAAADDVLAAFAADGVLDGSFWLPEIREDSPIPARVAIGFHLVDYVAHGWDVAASIGTDTGYAPELIAVALSIAAQVPTGAARTAPGAPFGPALPTGADRSPMEQLLATLGRSPSWSDQVSS